MLDFELNEEEKAEIAIYNERLNSVLQTMPVFPFLRTAKEEGIKPDKETEQKMFSALREHSEKVTPITTKARRRTLKYYASRTDKLTTVLEADIKNEIVRYYKTALMNPKDSPDFFNGWKRHATEALTPYLELLKEKAHEEYKKILAFLDYAFANADKIFEEGEATRPQGGDFVKVNPKRVKKYQQPIDKISQSLFNANENLPFYDNDATDVVIATIKGKKKAQEVTTAVAIDISKLDGISFSNGVMLDRYNKAIHDAMLSMYLAGNKGGSLNQLYKVINGNKETINTPKEKTLKDISEAVNKLRLTDITIDATGEAKLYGFSKAKIKNYLMPVKIVEVEINGNKAEGFVFLDEPPLYTYAKQKNQINAGDIGYFNVPLNTTPENIKLTSYLFERVQSAKNEKSKLGPVILYETIYEILEIDTPNANTLRKKRSDIRKKVDSILNSWTRAGFIKGFEEIKEKQIAVKIKILL